MPSQFCSFRNAATHPPLGQVSSTHSGTPRHVGRLRGASRLPVISSFQHWTVLLLEGQLAVILAPIQATANLDDVSKFPDSRMMEGY
jgi:hypothetical protein